MTSEPPLREIRLEVRGDPMHFQEVPPDRYTNEHALEDLRQALEEGWSEDMFLALAKKVLEHVRAGEEEWATWILQDTVGKLKRGPGAPGE